MFHSGRRKTNDAEARTDGRQCGSGSGSGSGGGRQPECVCVCSLLAWHRRACVWHRRVASSCVVRVASSCGMPSSRGVVVVWCGVVALCRGIAAWHCGVGTVCRLPLVVWLADFSHSPLPRCVRCCWLTHPPTRKIVAVTTCHETKPQPCVAALSPSFTAVAVTGVINVFPIVGAVVVVVVLILVIVLVVVVVVVAVVVVVVVVVVVAFVVGLSSLSSLRLPLLSLSSSRSFLVLVGSFCV